MWLASLVLHIAPHYTTSSGVVLRRSGRRAGGRCVALGHATIDDKVGTVDKTGLVAGKEKHSLCLLDGLAEAASGEVDFAAVTLLSVVAKPVLQEGSAADG
jgi:hypothetical protein